MLARFALCESLAYRNKQEEMCESISSYLLG
jgi:hypothetical protein